MSLRQFSSDQIPMALPNGSPNPVYLHRGPCRPLTPAEDIIADVAAEAIRRGIKNLERHFLDEAIFEFDTAISVLPHFPHAHWNRGQALLMKGEYLEGFREFDWRFKLFGDTLWHKGIPIWCGESLVGKRLILWHEHGYGDSLMFLRYVPMLRGMGAEITLALPEPLRRLAREQFDAEVLDEVPESFDRFDYRCPIFSLPPVLDQTIENVPSAPYLSGNAQRATIAKDRPIIGIAWSGNRKNSRDKHRSIKIDKFLSALDTRDHALYAIQQDELSIGREHGVITPTFSDFAETADCLMAMDHIVTVDTSVAHLAGALAHPSLHVLVPFVAYWPWYQSAAWYPTAHVYRQEKPGEWAPLFERVNANLWRGLQ